MKQRKMTPCICAILFVVGHLNLVPHVNASKLLASGFKSEQSFRQMSKSYQESTVVGNKDRYSKSASTLIPSIAVAASTASAAQISRNNDLWYLEQSVPGPPMPYQFGYEVRDPYGNEQYRKETSDGRAVTGSYGYWGPDGIYRHVDYIADHNGYRANIRTSEPGTANENPASVTINSLPVTGAVPPPSSRRSFNPGPSSYPPATNFPSLPPAPPSPSLPLPTPPYNPPQTLPSPRPSFVQPPVTRPNEGKTSNPKPRATPRPPSTIPIDWSRKTVTQQKSDTEFRKRTSSSSETENLPPTPISTSRTSRTLVSENSSSADLSSRTDIPSNPSSPYNFGKEDKPRVRLYATGGPLPGIRSVDDQRSIQEMYEFIKSELMAREKLRSIERIDDENLKAGVTYSPEPIEVSSPPTTSSSHHSSHKHQSGREERPTSGISDGHLEKDSTTSTISGNERRTGIPISTRFMYHFPKMGDATPSSQLMNFQSLPLVSHPRRVEHEDLLMKPRIEPPSPSVSRHSFSLPPSRPDLTLHYYPSDDAKRSLSEIPVNVGSYFQPLPVTRSHLIIHSNNQQPTKPTEPPKLTHQTLAVEEERNFTSSRFLSDPVSLRDYTISYPTSYHYASHQFMKLMPRKVNPVPETRNDERAAIREQNDHSGNEVKLRATVEVRDKKSPHIPEVIVGRWISNDDTREGAYRDGTAPSTPSTDSIEEPKEFTDDINRDCKEGDIMHRESTSPQALAPEISSRSLTTESTTFAHPLPQAAALISPDPSETSSPSSDSSLDYMLDDSYETSISSEERESTTNPSTAEAVTFSQPETTTVPISKEEDDDDDDEEDDDDDKSEEAENESENLSENMSNKKRLPMFHEGTINELKDMENSTHLNGNSITDASGLKDTMIIDQEVAGENTYHDDVFSAWK